MSSVGEAAALLRRCSEAAGRARGRLVQSVGELDGAASRLREAVGDSSSDRAVAAADHLRQAQRLVREAVEALDRADASVGDYVRSVLAVPGAAPGAQPPAMLAYRASANAESALGDPPLTVPSRSPDPAAVPEGEPEDVDERAPAQKQAAIVLQNQAAVVLAQAGYRVRQLPRSDTTISPDFEIEGRVFDCYTPAGTKLSTIRDALRAKIKKGQAERFVIVLGGAVSVDELRTYLSRRPPGRLREVLVVRNGTIERAWP